MEKTQCIYCKEEIAKDAKRCPHCRSWQSRFMPDVQSPRGLATYTAVLFPIILLFMGGTMYFAKYFVEEELESKGAVEKEQYRKLKIVNSEVVLSDCYGGKCVQIIGSVNNPTESLV